MKRSGSVWLAVVVGLSALASAVMAAPEIRNGSFEEDRYTKGVGLAQQNGGVAGWQFKGNVGINPIWKVPQAQRGPDSPYWDNGAIPHGKQLALIQGPGKLSQQVAGFEKGKRYRVTFRENARVQRRGEEWPRLRVLLGGTVVVSPHEVTPIGAAGETGAPFYRVESGEFTAPEAGAFELLFETVQPSGTTTLFLDDIRIVPAD